MVDVISQDLLDDELKAVVRVGGYKSEAEVVGHALEVLLVANPQLRINTAMELFRRSRITLTRAAEIAGLELEAFKQRLAEQGVSILVDEQADEVTAGVNLIHRLRDVP